MVRLETFTYTPYSMIPTSLYIHLPWCLQKCPYCDFNAHPLKGEIDFTAYIDRLIQDLKSHEALLQDRKLLSIFIGGGTPSLFSGQTLKPLFQVLRQYQDLDIEITLEANPGTQDYAHYSEYRDLGINRLSIGAQSFDPVMLKRLGRFHSQDQIHTAIQTAKSAGFSRINLDIMHSLPHQTTQEALLDLKTFLSHNLEHLSWYQLNIERNTLFHVQKPNLPSEEIQDEIDQLGSQLLEKHGYLQYETSAWTQNKPSTHNVNYWQFGDYIGIGAGAHSKITLGPKKIQRTIKHKHPKAYMKTLIQSQELVSQDEIILEYIIGQFRTRYPLYFQDFENKTGLSRSELIQKLKPAQTQGLLDIQSDQIVLTPQGFRHHNTLCLSLL